MCPARLIKKGVKYKIFVGINNISDLDFLKLSDYYKELEDNIDKNDDGNEIENNKKTDKGRGKSLFKLMIEQVENSIIVFEKIKFERKEKRIKLAEAKVEEEKKIAEAKVKEENKLIEAIKQEEISKRYQEKQAAAAAAAAEAEAIKQEEIAKLNQEKKDADKRKRDEEKEEEERFINNDKKNAEEEEMEEEKEEEVEVGPKLDNHISKYLEKQNVEV